MLLKKPPTMVRIEPGVTNSESPKPGVWLGSNDTVSWLNKGHLTKVLGIIPIYTFPCRKGSLAHRQHYATPRPGRNSASTETLDDATATPALPGNRSVTDDTCTMNSFVNSTLQADTLFLVAEYRRRSP